MQTITFPPLHVPSKSFCESIKALGWEDIYFPLVSVMLTGDSFGWEMASFFKNLTGGKWTAMIQNNVLCCLDATPIRISLECLSFGRFSDFITILKNYEQLFFSYHILYTLSLQDRMAASWSPLMREGLEEHRPSQQRTPGPDFKSIWFSFFLWHFYTYPFANLIHFSLALKKKSLWLE